MNEQITQVVNAIKVPNTGKTLGEESRVVKIEESSERLEIVYKRDGISVEDKRSIEDSIYEGLKDLVSEDKIIVKTVSADNQQYSKSAPAQQAQQKQEANLKAGHGPTGVPKKRVPGAAKVIAVSSGKGGVGKSTVTVNLALALAGQGKKVGIIDADIYGPSVPMLMGQRDAKPKATEGNKILPIDAWGVTFISFGLFIDESEPVIWRGPMLGGVLNQFLFDVNWGELDYLILDLPPGTGDMQLSMVQATEVDGAIVVSTPQDVALLDSKKGLEMFKKVNVPIIGMVENMSMFICDSCGKEHAIFGKDGVKAASDGLGVNYLGGIPLDIHVRESSDNGRPYMSNGELSETKISEAFNAVASNVDSYFNKESKGNFISKLFKK